MDASKWMLLDTDLVVCGYTHKRDMWSRIIIESSVMMYFRGVFVTQSSFANSMDRRVYYNLHRKHLN